MPVKSGKKETVGGFIVSGVSLKKEVWEYVERLAVTEGRTKSNMMDIIIRYYREHHEKGGKRRGD